MIAPIIPKLDIVNANFKFTFFCFIFVIIAASDVGIKKTKLVACATCCFSPCIL